MSWAKELAKELEEELESCHKQIEMDTINIERIRDAAYEAEAKLSAVAAKLKEADVSRPEYYRGIIEQALRLTGRSTDPTEHHKTATGE